jgi:hypothetical protein
MQDATLFEEARQQSVPEATRITLLTGSPFHDGYNEGFIAGFFSIPAALVLFSLAYGYFKKWTPEELHMLKTRSQITADDATDKLEKTAIDAANTALTNFKQTTDIPANSPKYRQIMRILTDNLKTVHNLADTNRKYRAFLTNAEPTKSVYTITGSLETNNLKIQSPDSVAKYSLEPITTIADPSLPISLANMKLVVS